MNEMIVRVSDLLEQVNRLKEMIDFHKHKSKELSMQRQYEGMKNDFLKELAQLLKQFGVTVQTADKAAA